MDNILCKIYKTTEEFFNKKWKYHFWNPSKIKFIVLYNISDSRVLLRVDYNVPMNQGKITDDLRITETLKTIDFILRNNPLYLVILSHLGRPNGSKNLKYSLKPICDHLSHLL